PRSLSHRPVDCRHRPSFPTRRSSDLVRPKPDMTSSATIRIPYFVHSSRMPSRYPDGGTRMPLVPVTGSTKNAAMFCGPSNWITRSEEHTSELQSRENLVCRLLLGKKN